MLKQYYTKEQIRTDRNGYTQASESKDPDQSKLQKIWDGHK